MSDTSGQAGFACGIFAAFGTREERFHSCVERVWIGVLEHAPGQDCIVHGFRTGQMPSVADGAFVGSFLGVLSACLAFEHGECESCVLFGGVAYLAAFECAFACGAVESALHFVPSFLLHGEEGVVGVVDDFLCAGVVFVVVEEVVVAGGHGVPVSFLVDAVEDRVRVAFCDVDGDVAFGSVLGFFVFDIGDERVVAHVLAVDVGVAHAGVVVDGVFKVVEVDGVHGVLLFWNGFYVNTPSIT